MKLLFGCCSFYCFDIMLCCIHKHRTHTTRTHTQREQNSALGYTHETHTHTQTRTHAPRTQKLHWAAHKNECKKTVKMMEQVADTLPPTAPSPHMEQRAHTCKSRASLTAERERARESARWCAWSRVTYELACVTHTLLPSPPPTTSTQSPANYPPSP